MSKLSKNRSAEKRLRAKRAQKASMAALYESYAKSGNNRKSKRTARKIRASNKMRNRLHPQIPCGNIACKRCYENFRPR